MSSDISTLLDHIKALVWKLTGKNPSQVASSATSSVSVGVNTEDELKWSHESGPLAMTHPGLNLGQESCKGTLWYPTSWWIWYARRLVVHLLNPIYYWSPFIAFDLPHAYFPNIPKANSQAINFRVHIQNIHPISKCLPSRFPIPYLNPHVGRYQTHLHHVQITKITVKGVLHAMSRKAALWSALSTELRSRWKRRWCW